MPAAMTGLNRNDIEVGFLTHVGMVRAENQDSYGFFEPETDDELKGKGRVLIVCDGMGGHNGGSIASKTTVDAMMDAIMRSNTRDPRQLLAGSIDQANQAVRNKGRQDPELRNMGTTCVAFAIKGSRMEVAHVGDSRAYIFRDNDAKQITRDHTYLNDLIDIGLLAPEMAKNHPERNIITRCVGMSDDLQIEFNRTEARPGDLFLLCSDGLYNHVEDEEMQKAVTTMDPQPACQALIDLANKRGGDDNITVAILKIKEIAELFDGCEADEETGAFETPPDTISSPRPGQDASFSGETPGSTPIIPINAGGVAAALPGHGIKIGFRGLLLLVGIEIILLIVLQVIIGSF